ncbi:MAG: DNA repair protein RadA [Desulfovibrionaceae bacterium]
MAKDKTIYTCSACGAHSPQWKGQCPSCRAWNTLEESVAARPSRGGAGGTRSVLGSQAPILLSHVSIEKAESYSSGLDALDALLGSGLVPGQAILLGGEPGIGKSTLLLQVAGHVAAARQAQGGCLYVSGEESLSQLKRRAERLGMLDSGLAAITGSRVEDALAVLDGPAPPSLIILDSVQMLTSSLADGLPGTVSQVRAVATELIERTKAVGTTCILVGHVTKDGQIAGPKLLEHMVDTVLSLEGDRRQMFRLLRVLKNRFGPNEDLLVFRMSGLGMEVVVDPATFFLEDRDPSLSGAAVVLAMDGQRPFAVEVQALVSRSYLSIPRRTGLGFDVNRLHLLLAVLEKRLKLNLGQSDIYVKIGGGLRMQDPGMDLGLVAAVLSSFYDRPLPERAVFWGEVDLNGRVRPVAGRAMRASQAARLGYDPVFCPQDAAGAGEKNRGRAVRGGADTVRDLQRLLFGA